MHIFREIVPLKAHLHQSHLSHLTVGLVPTMGALHKGHLSLIQAAKRENNIAVCSIFVNPAQFNNSVDLERYPRTNEKDIELLKAADCDVVFCPSSSELYPQESRIKIDMGPLSNIMEGEFRPGHFSGVALVVSKLFNIVKPDAAYFGQKDYQQFKVIANLVHELNFNLKLICMPIIREADGLAMSSRNLRLNETERTRASILYKCLQTTRAGLIKGNPFLTMKNEAFDLCKENGIRLEYLILADGENLAPLENIGATAHPILLIAAYVGEVRLIDNLFIR